MAGRKRSPRGLNIIIVGYGKVGTALIQQLGNEGHDITIIDKSPRKIQAATNRFDIMGIVGNGASYSVQMEAGIEKCDLLIAVTDSDELNLLCCTVAKRVGDCAAIARVRNPDYSREVGYLREKLGLAMIINPDLETANVASRILCLPSALEVNYFAHGQVELIRFKIPKGNVLDGLRIMDMSSAIKSRVIICVAERGDTVTIPSGSFTMTAGDTVSFVATRAIARAFLQDIGFRNNQVKNTMIVGGGRAGYYLANQLVHMGIRVKIIEKDPERCNVLSESLPKATIINGDGTNEELLLEEGVQDTESFVPLTGIDEENILLTLYARSTSNAKVITKINRVAYRGVINNLDLGSVIYPSYIITEAIVAYVRSKTASIDSNIETLSNIADSRVEAMEFRVYEHSPVTDVPIQDLPLKDNLLISFINRKGSIIVPTGQDCIKVGDSVMIVTTHKGFNDLQDILQR